LDQCKWPGCLVPLVYGGRGRPPEYCAEHAQASKRALDKARPDYGRTRKRYDACCLDAQAAKVRAYGTQVIRYQDWAEEPRYELYTAVVRVGSAHVKTAKVRVCMQHSQWRAFYRLERLGDMADDSEARAEVNDPQLTEVKLSGRFRLRMGRPDDYLVPDPSMQIEVPSSGVGWDGIWKPAVKSGYDAKLEAETRRHLALAPAEQKPWFEPTIAEPEPDPLIGYWRDKCAEGRRWHKTDRFRYAPEMNRGAGWCAKLIPIGRGHILFQTRRADHSHRVPQTAAGPLESFLAATS
jgi:hypothetical protein